MQNLKYFDQIDQYLNGELTVQEKATFEKELNQNPEIQRAMDQYLLSLEAIDVLVEDQLRADLDQLKKSEKLETEGNIRRLGQRTGGRRRLLTRLAAAASVAILVGFFGLNWASNTYSAGSLQEAYYTTPDWGTQRRGAPNPENPALKQALEALEAEQYESANSLLNQVITADSTTVNQQLEAQYYLGHVAYATGDYQKARIQFDLVRSQDNDRFREKAEWFTILASLGTGAFDSESKELLNKLKNDTGHSFSGQANELDTKVSSFWYSLVN